MLTKTANAILNPNAASPGQAIYDMMRYYRRGARYGVALAPIANDGRSETLQKEVDKASAKLDKIKELRDKNIIKIIPETEVLPAP